MALIDRTVDPNLRVGLGWACRENRLEYFYVGRISLLDLDLTILYIP